MQQLVRAAEANRRLSVVEQEVTAWLDEALNRWHLMRPEATYRFQRLRDGQVPRLTPPDLTQALLNLLNNAADACPEDLEVRRTGTPRTSSSRSAITALAFPSPSPRRSVNPSLPPRAKASAWACS